jgi:transposase
MRDEEGMIKRGELTVRAWTQIAPLLPENGRRGGRWRNHRTVVNGILWKLRTRGFLGATCPSATAPGRPATTASPAGAGTALGTDRLLAGAQAKSEAVGEVEWLVSVDSTIARAHQHATGARRKPSKQDAKRGSSIPRTRRSGGAVAG